MARQKGSANFAGTLEVLAGGPIDARSVVPTLADLTTASNFPYPYVGLETYVVSENKKYRLIAEDVTSSSNWEEIGSGGGSGEDGGKMLTGTLLANAWSSKSQTVSVTGLKSDTIGAIGILNTATSTQVEAAREALITPTTLANGSITFTCENVPSVNIPFGVLIPGGGSSGGSSLPDGGTTGQLLAKHSNDDGDAEWVNPPTVPSAYTSNPAMNGTASPGSSTNYAKGDHVHPSDSTKVDKVTGKGLSTNDYDDTEKAKVGKAYLTDDTAFTAIDDADYIPIYDTSATSKKKTLWSNIKSVLKTYFDTLYNMYTLPTASVSTKGGIKVDGVSIQIDTNGTAMAVSGTAGTAYKSKNINNATTDYIDNIPDGAYLFVAGLVSYNNIIDSYVIGFFGGMASYNSATFTEIKREHKTGAPSLTITPSVANSKLKITLTASSASYYKMSLYKL